MSAWSFARRTIFSPHSRACLWKHPGRALQMLGAAAGDQALALGERLRPGKQRECPVCRWRGRRFRTFLAPGDVIGDSICPRCGSFDRQRFLVFGMRGVLAGGSPVPRTLLGLSLSRAMGYLLAHEGLGRCFRSDFDRRDPRYQPDVAVDLRLAGFRDASFDWILCSHVLDHIPQLEQAVDEMVRLLRPGGLAWIQVAYQEDLERSHRLPHDRRILDDHAWRFGHDFTSLLHRPAWTVDAEHAAALPPELRRRHGIHPVERYWVARKRS